MIPKMSLAFGIVGVLLDLSTHQQRFIFTAIGFSIGYVIWVNARSTAIRQGRLRLHSGGILLTLVCTTFVIFMVFYFVQPQVSSTSDEGWTPGAIAAVALAIVIAIFVVRYHWKLAKTMGNAQVIPTRKEITEGVIDVFDEIFLDDARKLAALGRLAGHGIAAGMRLCKQCNMSTPHSAQTVQNDCNDPDLQSLRGKKVFTCSQCKQTTFA